MAISNIDRNYQPAVPSYAAADASPKHGYGWLRFELTMTVTQGQHDLEPAFYIADALGEHYILGSLFGLDPACKDTGAWGVYGPGETLGPVPMCVQVAASGPLTLRWTSSQTYQSIEVKFP